MTYSTARISFAALIAALCCGGLVCAPSPVYAQHAASGKSGLAHLRNGYQLEQDGELDAAIREYSRAIEADKSSPEGYLSRVSAYLKQKQYEKALKDSSTTIRLDPNLAEAFMVCAATYDAMKEPDKTLADTNRAIGIDPDLAPAYARRGHIRLGLKSYGQASTDFDAAIRLRP